MVDLHGKKLLILGASPNEVTMIRRARELGVYTIVTDYNSDHRVSPSKDVADEYWDISWADLDTLEKKCREEKVDGVVAGFSEIRVEKNILLCERLGLPCYINMEQLDITRDKIKFKECCRKSGVPVIKEYASVDEVKEYPVIVKPTDRAGSIGVSVAENREELVKAYAYALEKSLTGHVIIEDYIYKNNARKFDSYYGIINGEITFLGTGDVLNSPYNGYKRVVQNGWVLPSVWEKKYLQTTDCLLRQMIRNMGIQNGFIFFSGFSDDTGSFRFFECGYRLCTGHLYNYFSKVGLYSHLDLYICYALTGSAESIREDVRPGKALKNVTLNVYAKEGKIRNITGFDRLTEQIPDCLYSMTDAVEGQECSEDNAILSKIGMAYFGSESPDKLAADVARFYELIRVEDISGKDMVYDRVDPETVRTWWDRKKAAE